MLAVLGTLKFETLMYRSILFLLLFFLNSNFKLVFIKFLADCTLLVTKKNNNYKKMLSRLLDNGRCGIHFMLTKNIITMVQCILGHCNHMFPCIHGHFHAQVAFERPIFTDQ